MVDGHCVHYRAVAIVQQITACVIEQRKNKAAKPVKNVNTEMLKLALKHSKNPTTII